MGVLATKENRTSLVNHVLLIGYLFALLTGYNQAKTIIYALALINQEVIDFPLCIDVRARVPPSHECTLNRTCRFKLITTNTRHSHRIQKIVLTTVLLYMHFDLVEYETKLTELKHHFPQLAMYKVRSSEAFP